MTRERIERALRREFSPARLTLEDHSAEHAGHRPGAPPEGTHWSVLVISDRFAGLSRLERHRLVQEVIIAADADGSLHALSIRAMTPSEWDRSGGPASAASL